VGFFWFDLLVLLGHVRLLHNLSSRRRPNSVLNMSNCHVLMNVE